MAVGPIDYTVDVGNPFQAAVKGFEAANTVRTVLDKREEEARQRAAALAMQRDLQAFSQKPDRSAADYASMIARYPQLSEHYKRAFDAENPERKANQVSELSRIYAAVHAGQPEVAIELLRSKAEAARTAGAEKDATGADALARLLKLNPQAAQTTIGLALYGATGDDKFAEMLGKLGAEQRAEQRAPAEQTKLEAETTKVQAEAQTAQTTAKFSESKALADLEAAGWNVKKIQSDIATSRENTRIAALNAELSRENNALKREELQVKLAEAQEKRDQRVREYAAEGEAALSSLDTTNGILADILGDEDTLRAAVGRSAWRGALPGTKARTMAGRIEQLQNAIASTNLDKLKGAMSDKDILFLKNIATNLDRWQDEDAFVAELKRIGRELARARDRVARRYGAEGTELSPVTVATDADFDKLPSGAFFKAPDGTTRRKP